MTDEEYRQRFLARMAEKVAAEGIQLEFPDGMTQEKFFDGACPKNRTAIRQALRDNPELCADGAFVLMCDYFSKEISEGRKGGAH